jgi:hypothetical protein
MILYVYVFYFLYYQRHCDERSDVATDAASERRGSLLTMPNRKEEGKANPVYY